MTTANTFESNQSEQPPQKLVQDGSTVDHAATIRNAEIDLLQITIALEKVDRREAAAWDSMATARAGGDVVGARKLREALADIDVERGGLETKRARAEEAVRAAKVAELEDRLPRLAQAIDAAVTGVGAAREESARLTEQARQVVANAEQALASARNDRERASEEWARTTRTHVITASGSYDGREQAEG